MYTGTKECLFFYQIHVAGAVSGIKCLGRKQHGDEAKEKYPATVADITKVVPLIW